MAKIWQRIIWIFERADIVPPLIVVSAYHYAGALYKHDYALVAIILGVLIDLGHYRIVKAFFKAQTKGRFTIMVLMTLMTGYCHWLWYRDWLLALIVPALIICLALLSRWERWETQAQSPHYAIPMQASNEPMRALPKTCAHCGASFESTPKLAAHVRWSHKHD